MLSTLLTNLQSLISTRFVVSSVFPVLVFWVLNGAMLFWLHAPFRALAADTMTKDNVGQSTFLLGSALIAGALSAYIFSALLPSIQSVMEGRWPGRLIRFFIRPQVRKLDTMNDEIAAVIRLRGRLEERLFNGKSRAEHWKDRLAHARWRGVGAHPNANNFTSNSPSAIAVAELEERRRAYDLIDAPPLNGAVALLATNLLDNNADLPGPDGDFALDTTHTRLRALIDEAVRYAQREHIRLTNRLHFSFGAQRPAPTLMGNVANTIQSYAEQRYNLNLEIFWSRMQRAIRRDKDHFAPMMQESKTQFDFLIACSSLTAFWSVIWIVTVISVKGGRAPFVLAAAGPLIAYLWYRVGVAHYRTFADVLRTSVDLFRFELLKDLRFALPADVSDERELWDVLHRLTSYYEPVNLRFQETKPS